ncbi:MAG: hypothetical protein ACREUG_15285 [Steroidobacteraceae bacterium]
MTVSPGQAAITEAVPLSLTATITDPAGVTWTVAAAGGGSAGSIAPATSLTGAAVAYTAPANPGTYTITATGVTDKSKTATTTVYVTNLAGVYTYHDDAARDGANTEEYALTPANVNTTSFGKLFSCTVDGAIYAQPLWVGGVTVGGAKHNVVLSPLSTTGSGRSMPIRTRVRAPRCGT